MRRIGTLMFAATRIASCCCIRHNYREKNAMSSHTPIRPSNNVRRHWKTDRPGRRVCQKLMTTVGALMKWELNVSCLEWGPAAMFDIWRNRDGRTTWFLLPPVLLLSHFCNRQHIFNGDCLEYKEDHQDYLCWIVHSHKHTHMFMRNSYKCIQHRSYRLRFSLWFSLFFFLRVCHNCHSVCHMLSFLCIFFSGFCEFGCQYQCNWLPGKTRLQNDLLRVEWDVKFG